MTRFTPNTTPVARRALYLFASVAATGGLAACDSSAAPEGLSPVALQVRVGTVNGESFSFNAPDLRLTLFARPVAADSTLLGGPVAATWDSSDSTVIAVDQMGTVTSRARNGVVRIEARYSHDGRVLVGGVQGVNFPP